MTLRYAVKRDDEGQHVLVGQAMATPRDSAQLLMRLLQDEASEVFALLLLSTRLHVIAYYEVSRGTLDSTLVHPRLCSAQHNLGYVTAVVMWGSRLKGQLHGPRPQHNPARLASSLHQSRGCGGGGR
jgi:DNA repair protein RadC